MTEIRLAGAADVADLCRLVAGFRDHLRAVQPSDAELAARLPGLLADRSLEFALALLERSPVGYTMMRWLASPWSAGGEAFLEDLYVLASARGRQVGRALLRHALARARAKGAGLLALTTHEKNSAAQALYRAEGLAPQRSKLWGEGAEVRWVIELA